MRRWLRRGAVGAVLLAVLVTALSVWIERTGLYEPPALPRDHAALDDVLVQDADGVTRCGPAWLHDDDGVSELFLAGDAVSRGHAVGMLCWDRLRAQEDALLGELDRLLPAGPRRWLVRKFVLGWYRDLPAYVDLGTRLELAATSHAMRHRAPHPLEQEFPEFHRTLFYQTLYDTGQSMAEAGLVDAGLGCTSFVADAPGTGGSHRVVGRNCDFEAGEVFDERKIVYFIRPDVGQAYVHVAWAGMAGVVTGVNESGLVVLLHAARTESTRRPQVGVPVPLILRDALLPDRTVEDVARRLRASPRHAAAIVVAVESSTGRAAVIETDDRHTVVYEGDTPWPAASNHLRHEVWDDDEVAVAARRRGSSGARLARAREVLAASDGVVDVAGAAALLRDRRAVGGGEAGLGNRTTLSASIVAHAVVYETGPRRLHVARAPRAMGAFVAYDLGAFFDGRDPRGPDDVRPESAHPKNAHPKNAHQSVSVGADDLDLPERVAEGRRALRAAQVELDAGRSEEATERARRAVERLDRSPEALLVLARAEHACGRPRRAAELAREALRRQPVPGPEEEALRALAGDAPLSE